MKFIKKNRFRLFDEENGNGMPESNDEPIRKNRIRRIESIRKKYAVIGITALVLIAAGLFYFTGFFTKKPKIFTAEKREILSETQEPKKTIVQGTEAGNPGLEKGINNYLRGYYNNAVSDFKEVIESGAADKDKAVAYMYIGLIYDEKGSYDSAVEYFLKALKYDGKNDAVYRHLAATYRHKKDYKSAAGAAGKALDINPDKMQNQLLSGNILFEQGKYREAISRYEKALNIDPDDPAILHNIGLACLKTGDELAGIEYLKKAGAAGGTGNTAFLSFTKLGALYLDRDEYDSAEKYLRAALKINPDDAAARFNLGLVYQNTNRQEEALAEFMKADELSGDNEEILENLGRAYSSLNDYERSIGAYNRLLDTNRRNVSVLAKIAEIYRKKGDSAKAYDIYKRITVLEPASENARTAYASMGNLLDDLGRSDEAVEAYSNSLTIGEDDSILYNLGIAYKNAGKPELAVRAWRKASELNTDNPNPRTAIADMYNENGLTDLAIEEYENIARRWSGMQDAHLNLALLYYKKNLFDYSEASLKTAIELNGGNDSARRAYIYLARIGLKKTSGNAKDDEIYAAVQSNVNKALMIKPNDPEAFITLGSSYYRQGMFDKAIETFYLALSSSKNNQMIAEAYNNIGKSYHKKGDYKNALKAFSSGIEHDPSSEELRINRKASMQAYEDNLD